MQKTITENSYHVTEAISSHTIAPVFSQRYSDLGDPRYDLKSADKTIEIGTLDPRFFSLIVAVYVSHRDATFKMTLPDAECFQLRFGIARLIIFSTYFCLPPLESASLAIARTVPPEQIDDPVRRLDMEIFMRGFSSRGCVDDFLNKRIRHRAEAIEIVKQRPEPTKIQREEMISLARSGFLNAGTGT